MPEVDFALIGLLEAPMKEQYVGDIIAKQTGQTKSPDWLAGATVQMAPCSARFPC